MTTAIEPKNGPAGAQDATGGDSLNRLVRLADAAKKAAWDYKNAVKEVYPIGSVLRLKTHHGHTIIGEVIGHGADWSCKYPDEIRVRNIKTGKHRTAWVSQILPNDRRQESHTKKD